MIACPATGLVMHQVPTAIDILRLDIACGSVTADAALSGRDNQHCGPIIPELIANTKHRF